MSATNGYEKGDAKLEYLLGKAKLYKLTPAEESELRALMEKEVPSLSGASMKELVDTGLIRIGIRTIHENKINEINDKIKNWGDLPSEPPVLMDTDPFVNLGSNVKAYLKKDGQKIKISTNVGDLEISEDELGDRIGTGLDFLELLSRRLDAFKVLIFSKGKK